MAKPPGPASAATVRKARRKLAASNSVPYRVANTRSLSTHRCPIRIRWASWRCRCSRSASTQSAGSSKVRRDRFVFVSPPARSDRTAECSSASVTDRSHHPPDPGDSGERPQSSIRAPMSSETTRMRASTCLGRLSEVDSPAQNSANLPGVRRALRRLAQQRHVPLHQIRSLRPPNRMTQNRQQLGEGVRAHALALPRKPTVGLKGRQFLH